MWTSRIFQKPNLQTTSKLSVVVSWLIIFVWLSSDLETWSLPSSKKAKRFGSKDLFPPSVKLKTIDNLINSSKFEAAAAASRLLLKRFPNSAELNADLALASLYMGDQKTAQIFAEKTLKLDSRNHEAHWVLTNVYSAQGRVQDSSRELGLSMTYRSQKPCKPCQKNSKQNLELLKSIK